MEYVMHYDVAALVLLMVLLGHFCNKKRILTTQSKVFVRLIGLALVSNITDLITMFTLDGSFPVFWNTLLLMVYFMSFNLLPVGYLSYVMTVTMDERMINKWRKLAVPFPALVSMVLILITPWTKAIFYFDENGMYYHGKLHYVLYVIAMFYMIAIIGYVIRFRKKLTKINSLSVLFSVFFNIGALVAQILIPGLMIAQFTVAITVLLLYLSLENPEELLDKNYGIYNKEAYNLILKSNINHGKKFEVLGIELEGLRHIRKTMGIENERVIMKEISEYLMAHVGKNQAFLIKSNRFAIMGKKSKQQWEELIEELRNYFGQAFQIMGLNVSISAYMGMIAYPDNVKCFNDAEEFLDYSFILAREFNGEQVAYAGMEHIDRMRREQHVIRLMRRALKEGTFDVYYQPIYSVERKCYTSAEALVRLMNTEIGFISPEEFIPLAEKNGLILEIGEFVFREVCRFIVEHRIGRLGIESIHVNLSVVQCMQEELNQKLLDIMDEFGLEYCFISLEITETAAAMSSDILRKNMNGLIEKGIHFALDDYGTGYSNTANIIQYPFHTIKLDKSMLWSAMENEKAMCALKHSIAMMRDMSLNLIAEGVETAEQAQILEKMGCSYFQGYYYSRPVCKEDFIKSII